MTAIQLHDGAAVALFHEMQPDDEGGERGMSLVEVSVAIGILSIAIVAIAQLLGVATRSNLGSRDTTYTTTLAAQKLEELRSTPNLNLSPANSLADNVAGFVDYIDQFGQPYIERANPQVATIYTRRWAIAALAADPVNTVVIQVRVLRSAREAAKAPGPEETRLVTVAERRPR